MEEEALVKYSNILPDDREVPKIDLVDQTQATSDGGFNSHYTDIQEADLDGGGGHVGFFHSNLDFGSDGNSDHDYQFPYDF
ncbi:hypothetical protein WN943_023156 [Citrus x changshan-huyou]